ncbi:MAG: DUF1573 domain-containing protein [Bacteroidales bacterium]|nr:DUF1573 domain-containing protein [Bacteroidales bacterium]
MKHIFSIFSLLLAFFLSAGAQEKISEGLEADKTVHNFGDILLKSGPVSCTFTITNVSDKPAVIYSVVSSCGCTNVDWTKEPLMPGKKGKISVTYSNDEGPYPFDKTLTVYISDVKKPVLLKIRGVSVEQPKPLEESYPIAFGPFALKNTDFLCGNINQGERKSEAAMVANLSDKPIEVTFTDISDHLDISVHPNPIPARSTAEMSFSVTSCRKLWGKNTYTATPQINGKTYGDEVISISAFTKENFDKLSEADKSTGPRPMFKESTFQAGKVRKGDVIHAKFTFENAGKKPFGVYKVDIDAPKWAHGRIPRTEPGGWTTFTVDIDTSDMAEGELLTIVTLTTNSPLRPIVNLFITGWIE